MLAYAPLREHGSAEHRTVLGLMAVNLTLGALGEGVQCHTIQYANKSGEDSFSQGLFEGFHQFLRGEENRTLSLEV